MIAKSERKSAISEYYKILGNKAIFPERIIDIPAILTASKKDTIVISDSKFYRGIAKLKSLKRAPYSMIENTAIQYFALCDAFQLLSDKKVSVFFYNRVGLMKHGYEYSESAKRRMEQKLSFPVMLEDPDKYENDFRELLGDKYSKEYVKSLGEIPQIIKKGDKYCHEDCASKFVNVVGGKRVTCNQPEVSQRTIHIYGRCGVFGYAVEDSQTLPSLLQQALIERGITDITVINHGLWGGEDEQLDHNFLNDAIGIKEGDIVLFYRKHFDKRLLAHFEQRGVRYKEITKEWHESEIARSYFFDKPGHMTVEGYQEVVQIILDNMLSHNFKCNPSTIEHNGHFKAERLNSYLKATLDGDFKNGIDAYIGDILKKAPINNKVVSGAIVMNCNPFTKGHRYLIETAAAQVERLYVFVVEEDKSFFKFEDRFEMVKLGSNDLKNVVVVPSGKFIISALTFPEYFMKDYVREKDFNVSRDVEVFCKYIAPPLNISIRFVGEEPFDPVTFNYNENMKKLLPEYGMRLCEIPRLTIDGDQVINATKVRELLKAKKINEISKYVPETTLNILLDKYME